MRPASSRVAAAEVDAVVLPFPPPTPSNGDPDLEVLAPPHFRLLVQAERQRARREREQTEEMAR